MQLSKFRQFLSIVLVFFFIGSFYFGYKRIASRNQPALLNSVSEATQNLAVDESKISLAGPRLKPFPFCKVEEGGLVLCFPAEVEEVKGVGFHESEKEEALEMQPIGKCYMRESTETVSRVTSMSRFPVLFIMYSRGRHQSASSAVDVAVKPNTSIRSPVNGVVTKVDTYYLYGKYIDCRVEIKPEDNPELRVAMIHLDNVVASVGQKVYKGNTKLGTARELSHHFDSQINEYVDDECDHSHIQVNRYVPEQAKKE